MTHSRRVNFDKVFDKVFDKSINKIYDKKNTIKISHGVRLLLYVVATTYIAMCNKVTHKLSMHHR